MSVFLHRSHSFRPKYITCRIQSSCRITCAQDSWRLATSVLPPLPDNFMTVMKITGILQYTEQWHKKPFSHCRRFSCVDFSLSGNFIAFGGLGSLVLADACDGKTRAVIENQQASLVAVQWCLAEFAICVYDNGTIIDVALTTVSCHRIQGRTYTNI